MGWPVPPALHNANLSATPERRMIGVELNQLHADLPVPEDDGAAGHLNGRPAPPFHLPSTSGGTLALDALGPGRTVLYVYPLTGRPDTGLPESWENIPGARGCTAEACDFRDHYHDLRAAGATGVFGVSVQDSDYQQEVVARLRLPFAMLSDPGLRLVELLRLPTFTAEGLTLFKRLTLVMGNGVIEHVFYPIFPPNEHARQVLVWLRSHSPAPSCGVPSGETASISVPASLASPGHPLGSPFGGSSVGLCTAIRGSRRTSSSFIKPPIIPRVTSPPPKPGRVGRRDQYRCRGRNRRRSGAGLRCRRLSP